MIDHFICVLSRPICAYYGDYILLTGYVTSLHSTLTRVTTRQRYSVFPHASANEVQQLQWCPHSAVNACQSLFSQRTKSIFLTARNSLLCRTVFSPFVTWSGGQSPVVPSFCTDTTAVRRLVAIHTKTSITDTNTLTRPDFDKTLLSLFSRRFSNTNEKCFHISDTIANFLKRSDPTRHDPWVGSTVVQLWANMNCSQ